MDGYSVEEAAEVLGIPQGRVWELIARGVLAGVAEGRSDMRVMLKPAATPSGDPSRPGGGNGGGTDGGRGAGEGQVEASPFRELLTEFRNLTERYGQALLALGEARGEVAALRSRVEVIEARMDMRLPLRSASTVAWELPDRYAAEAARAPQEASAAAVPTEAHTEAPPEPPTEDPVASEPSPAAPTTAEVSLPEPPLPGDEPAQPVDRGIQAEEQPPEPEPEPEPQTETEPVEPPPESVAEAERAAQLDVDLQAEPEAEGDTEPGSAETEPFPDVRFVHPAEPAVEPPRRRVTGGRAAVAGLAEALARAEDPTLADLPGAREAAAALAALQQAVDSPPPAPRAHEEAELPAEEADAGRAEPEAAPEPTAAVFATPMSEVGEEPTPTDEPDAADSADTEPADETPPQTEPPDARGDEAPSVYSTDVVEPDWFADGDFTWLDASDRPSDTPAEPEAEMDHVEREAESPAVDALQQAFDQPATAEAEPTVAEPEPTVAELEPTVAEPVEDAQPVEETRPDAGAAREPEVREPEAEEPEAREPEGEAPAEAIQDAFDAPDVTHRAEAEAWPLRDRAPIAGPGGVGFGLFRSADDAPRARVTPAAPPTDEEAILWFGDEFEAGDLEVAAPGWRDQERVEAHPALRPDDSAEPPAAEPPAAEPPAAEPPAAEPSAAEPLAPEPATPAPTDEEIARLASQGWDNADVEAIRSYLGRAPGIAHPQDPSTPAHDQDWLRGRRGPAAGAYRRLRRLFQG